MESLKVSNPNRSPCFRAARPTTKAAAINRSGTSRSRRGSLSRRRQNLCPCGASAEPRGVDRHVDLLRLLNLEDFGDRMATFGSGLPVDLIEAVTGDIFAQFFELSSLAVLAPHMNAVAAPLRKSAARLFLSCARLG